ncbi:MAG TPA: DUF4959 domain-containing protein [Prolixibacteraceae bacterium]|nr:DUF4959 domain-containing protein [Prolixibacteraceae bacterium]
MINKNLYIKIKAVTFGKRIPVLLGLVLLLILFSACQKETKIGQYPLDSVAPPPPTIVSTTPTNGGADVKFTVPADEDLLYVEARYKVKGEIEKVTKVANYENILKLSGLGDTLLHSAELRSVDRSQNKSTPVNISFNPLTPIVKLVSRSLSLKAVYGGIVIDWTNATGEAIVVIPSYYDANGDTVNLERVYSGAATGTKLVDGLDTTQRTFSVKIMDRWDNLSEPVVASLKPKAEVFLDKSGITFFTAPWNSDAGYGTTYANMFDGNMLTYWHSSTGMPANLTFDLGKTIKMSRIMVNAGLNAYTWSAWRTLNIYGRVETPNPGTDGSLDSWKLIKSNVTFPPPPSGAAEGTGANKGPDGAWARGEGMMIIFDPDVEDTELRYLRIEFTSDFGANDCTSGEFSVWYTY